MNEPVQKGSYILLINLPASSLIRVGKLGEIYFHAGWYAYVGSAMRGFSSRLPHHVRNNKKPHWHIDYLLQVASIKRIITFETNIRMECATAQDLMKRFECIPGFGCRDCRCKSHLFYSNTPDAFPNHLVIDGQAAKIRKILYFSPIDFKSTIFLLKSKSYKIRTFASQSTPLKNGVQSPFSLSWIPTPYRSTGQAFAGMVDNSNINREVLKI